MFVLFEEFKKGRTFTRVDTPAFLDNESRNAQTKAIDIRYLSSFRNSSGRTIQRFIGCRSGVRNAAGSKITLQLLMKTEVAAASFIRIVGTKKCQ